MNFNKITLMVLPAEEVSFFFDLSSSAEPPLPDFPLSLAAAPPFLGGMMFFSLLIQKTLI